MKTQTEMVNTLNAFAKAKLEEARVAMNRAKDLTEYADGSTEFIVTNGNINHIFDELINDLK